MIISPVAVAVVVVAVGVIVGAAAAARGRAAKPKKQAPAEQSGTLIDNAEQAQRLARAIAADIALYNADAVADARRAGAVTPTLQPHVDEGRALFQARVAPRLHRHFDGAIAVVVRGS